MKKLALFFTLFSLLLYLIIPFLFANSQGESEETEETEETDEAITAYSPEIYERADDMEDYIKGVVCAEMPAAFEEEALKAQSVAARTYAYRAVEGGADIKNPSEFYQAYLSKEELRNKWGDNFENYYGKVSDAVEATTGEIMTYNDEPILAVFHSTAAGATENAENVWASERPYLKSVDSHWDENAPNYKTTVNIARKDIISGLKKSFPNINFDNGDISKQIKITKKSKSGYATEVAAGDAKISGNAFRMALGLKSACFDMEKTSDGIAFTTKGYGHGAGMSQYGANFMAMEGSDYRQILEHYYSGVAFKNIY